jgi:hypothetical protein
MRLSENTKSFGIDLDADPIHLPPGFEVVEHVKGGLINWIPSKPQIALYLTPGQRKGIVPGEAVFEELATFEGTPVNANALDYFLDNLSRLPWIIPPEWKLIEHYTSKHILFWGTRYRFEGGICVRSLDWNADARERVWKSGYCWVDVPLNAQFPAAMLRKSAPKV